MRYAHLYKILIKTVQNLRLICEKIHIYIYIYVNPQLYKFTTLQKKSRFYTLNN